MTVIQNELNVLNYFFASHPKAILSVGKNDQGVWLIADDDLEITVFNVVRYMIKNNLKQIGKITLHNNGDTKNYSLHAMTP